MIRYLVLLLLLPMLADGRELPFLESRVAPQRPYIQAQVRLTLRLVRESHLQRGDFLLPEIPGVLVEFVQEDEPRPIDYQGKALEMIEQRYLLFPQRSGPLRLPAPLFSGRELFVEGESVSLQVRPPPAEARLPWLPASRLELTQQWVDAPDQWRVGEPRIRRITLQARGLTAAQLPKPTVSAPDGLQIQRLRVERRDQVVAGVMTSSSSLYLRLIPTRAGRYRLDPVTIHWWNTDSDRPAATTLGGESLSILPSRAAAAGGAGLALPTVVETGAMARRDSAAFGFIGLSLLLVLLLIAGWRLLPPVARRVNRWWRCRRARRRFHRACAADDPRNAADTLLAWASAAGLTACTTLPELAAVMGSTAAQRALLQLDRALYGRPAADWPGKRMPRLIGSELSCSARRRRRSVIQPVMPPLNP